MEPSRPDLLIIQLLACDNSDQMIYTVTCEDTYAHGKIYYNRRKGEYGIQFWDGIGVKKIQPLAVYRGAVVNTFDEAIEYVRTVFVKTIARDIDEIMRQGSRG